MTYLDPSDSDRVVEWAAQRFAQCAMVSYGQCVPYDAFGRVMRATMTARLSPVHLERYPTADAQRARYVRAGFDESATRAVDLAHYWRSSALASERERIAQLEMFDEYEDWHVKLAHYFIVTATRGLEPEFAKTFLLVDETVEPPVPPTPTNIATEEGIPIL